MIHTLTELRQWLDTHDGDDIGELYDALASPIPTLRPHERLTVLGEIHHLHWCIDVRDIMLEQNCTWQEAEQQNPGPYGHPDHIRTIKV